jgi:hypothetical protein
VLDQLLRDQLEPVHRHEQHERPGVRCQTGPVDALIGRPAGIEVTGDHGEVGGQAAVRQRDAGRGRAGGRRGQPGDDGHRHPGCHAREPLLATPAEHERVAALQPDDALAGQRALDEHRVDLNLRQVLSMRGLATVDHLDVGGQRVEQVARREAVDDHDVSVRDEAATAHGDELRIARPATDQHHLAARRRTLPPDRQFAQFERGRDRVAQGYRSRRVVATVDGHGQSVLTGHRRRPRRAARRVVRPDAEHPARLGRGSNCGIHRRIVGARHDEPRTVQVGRLERPQPDGDAQRGDGVGDLRRNYEDIRFGLVQRPDSPGGHRPAAHHDHLPGGQVEQHRKSGHRAIVLGGRAGRRGDVKSVP